MVGPLAAQSHDSDAKWFHMRIVSMIRSTVVPKSQSAQLPSWNSMPVPHMRGMRPTLISSSGMRTSPHARLARIDEPRVLTTLSGVTWPRETMRG